MTVTGQLKSLIRLKLNLIMVISVTLALLFSAARLAMYSLPSYKGAVEDWLSSEQIQVSIDQISSEWHYLRPALDARGVRLTGADGETLFQLGRLQLELDLIQTLRRQQPIFQRIVLDRPELKLRRNNLGEWRIQAASSGQASGLGSDGQTLLQGLLRHGGIQLVNALIQVELDTGYQYPPQVINAVLQRRGLKSSLQVRLERAAGEALELQVEATGVPGTEGFGADFYVHIPQQDESFWRQWLSPAMIAGDGFNLSRLQLATELWGHWQGRSLRQVSGRLQVPMLSALSQQKALLLSAFDSRFLLSADGNGQWQWQLEDIQGQLSNQPLPLDRLHGQWRDDRSLLLSIEQLRLAELSTLLLNNPLVPAAVTEPLQVLQPNGMLKNLQLTLGPFHQGSAVSFDLTADLDRVGVSAWNGAPALAGVDGLLQLDLDGGRVDFDGPLQLSFPDLYRQGWSFDRARGVVSWQLDSGGQRVQVNSELLQLWQQGIEANGRFSLDMPLQEDKASEFSLMIGMDNSDGRKAPLFVPDKVLEPSLFQWLSDAILAGHLNSGGFVYHGALESWATPPSVQMYFDVSNATVKYQPQWPEVRKAKAFTLIKNDEVLVAIDAGRVYDTSLRAARVYLPPGSQQLQIRASLQGPAADGRRVLLESPVREALGDAFAHWQLSGDALTEIDLGIDLEQPEQSRIRVDTELSGGRYASESLALVFEQLNGRIRYHEYEGLSSGPITAQLWGRPLTARIDTLSREDGDHTLVEVAGDVDMLALQSYLKQPVMELFTGTTGYHATLDICGGSDDCTKLTVASDLMGVVGEGLPEPFAKTADQAMALKVRTNLAGERQWLRVQYGPEYHSLLALGPQGLESGEIVLGFGQAQPRVQRDGLWVRGALAQIDAEQWRTFLDRLFPKSVSAAGRPRIDPLLKAVDLSTQRLALGDQTFSAVDARFESVDSGWRLTVASPAVTGTLLLPFDPEQPFVADLQRLQLPASDSSAPTETAAGAEAEVEKPDPLADFNPSELPALRLNVDEFLIGDEPYGRWRLRIDSVDGGVHIAGVQGMVRHLNSDADIRWLKTPQGHQTQVSLQLKAGQIGDVLQAWGSPRAVESKNTDVKGALTWQGSPLHFNLESLDGNLSMSTGPGRFLESGATAGVLKLFGLLNFKALGRRLRLDFTDFSKQGISFDSISAAYRLEKGVATSTEPLKLAGPSADIQLEGSIDLVHETLEQKMELTLPVAENLPLTAILLGTPQVAGALFLVEKLVGKQIRKFTTVRYRVSGDWSDPLMEPLVATPASNRSLPIER